MTIPTLASRVAWLTVLLCAEYVAIALGFDGVMHRYHGPWQYLTELVTFSVLGVGGLGVLFGRSLLSAVGEQLAAIDRLPGLLLPMTVHGLAMAAFVGTVFTMSRFAGSQPGFAALVVVALALGALATGALVFASLPPATVRNLAVALRRPMVLGMVAGGLAYGVGVLASQLWRSLASLTLTLSAALLSLFGFDVYADAELKTLQVDSFAVEVARECSGLEGMGLIAVFLGLYLWAARRRMRFPHALGVLPLGVVAMYVANLLRIALLVTLGARVSPAVALGGFHSKAGWLFFCAVAFGLVAVTARMRVLQAHPEPAGAHDAVARGGRGGETSQRPVAAFLMPLLSILALSLLTGLLTPTGFDALYGVRLVGAAVALVVYRQMIWPVLGRPALHGLLAGVFSFALWMGLSDAPSEQANGVIAEGLAGLPDWGAAIWVGLRVLGSVVVVPVVEELTFRGFVMRRVTSAEFTKVPADRLSWPGLLVSSIAFGVLHSDYVAGAVVGVVYGLAYVRRGHLSDAIAAHATTNALLCVYVLGTGHYGYW